MDNAGLPERITRPDGTISLFTYGEDASGNRLRTVKSGVPNAAQNDIIDGTITVTTTNPQGHIIRTRVTDAMSAIARSS